MTLGTPSDVTTTGFLASGTVTPDGEAGFAKVVYEPSGTPITSSSPTAGLVIFNSGVTTPQAVSIAVDQLTPNTSYAYELQATEDDNDAVFVSATGTVSTKAAPTGPGTPINPLDNPSANGIFGQCSGDPACVNDMNGVRAAQEVGHARSVFSATIRNLTAAAPHTASRYARTASAPSCWSW